jgi:hypothetical protein
MALNGRQVTREFKVQFHWRPSKTSLSPLAAKHFDSLGKLISTIVRELCPFGSIP